MLVEKLPLDSDKVRELRDSFWGGIDAYRFKLAVGRDLVLNPPQAGGALNTFGYPYAEAAGRNAPGATGRKIVRGGSFHDRPKRCRSAFRLSYPEWQAVHNVGLRVVCSPMGDPDSSAIGVP